MNEVQYIPIDDIIPYENNPRDNDAAVDAVAASIDEFGFQQPLVCDKDMVLVVGHTRLKAAKRLGYTQVPVVVASELTDEQVRAYRLADNKTAERATWDFDLLAEELDAITTIDMTQFDFDISTQLSGITDMQDDEVEEEEEPTEVPSSAKRGDVWQLGRHRLMCGDARSEDDVDLLIDGNAIDLALTDPPYGVSIVKRDGHLRGGGANEPFKGRTNHADKPFGSREERGSTHGYAKNAIIPQPREYAPIIGDESTDTARDNYEIIKDISDVQIIFGGNYFTDFLPPSRCWIVWDKKVPRESFFAQVELAWCSKDGNALIYEHQWSGLIREGSRDLELATRVHPTQKPVGMLSRIIEDFTDDGGTVIDCFGGSGSTLIAAEHTGRTCYIMELSPDYCDVILQRWQNLTGEEAVLLNGEDS